MGTSFIRASPASLNCISLWFVGNKEHLECDTNDERMNQLDERMNQLSIVLRGHFTSHYKPYLASHCSATAKREGLAKVLKWAELPWPGLTFLYRYGIGSCTNWDDHVIHFRVSLFGDQNSLHQSNRKSYVRRRGEAQLLPNMQVLNELECSRLIILRNAGPASNPVFLLK